MFAPTVPTTVSPDIISANTFGAVNPEPVPEKSARVVSETTNDLTGFLPNQDRVTITQEARDKAQASELNKSADAPQPEEPKEPPSDEFIQVSSSIGRAAQTGNLSRQEAMAIYQKIASLI